VKQTTGSESPDWRSGCVFALEDLHTSLEDLEAVMTKTMQESGVF
jgi:hypothetical protein